MILSLIHDPNPLAHFWEWFLIHTGGQNESSSYYGEFSGFISDLGEVTLLAAMVALFRHHNCRIKRCWRLGKTVGDSPILACHKHHPGHPGTKRNVPPESIEAAHEAAHWTPNP